jgi:hypothetical protein
MRQPPVLWVTKMLLRVLIYENVSTNKFMSRTGERSRNMKYYFKNPLSVATCRHWATHSGKITRLYTRAVLLLRWSEHHENRSRLTDTQFCISKTLKWTVVQWRRSLLMYKKKIVSKRRICYHTAKFEPNTKFPINQAPCRKRHFCQTVFIYVSKNSRLNGDYCPIQKY